jgi:catechol 2,3-dioxygenase-like lactoylglutathione lyase family enzyme
VRKIDFMSNAQIAIHATDLARAREFHHDKLGFRLIDKTAEQLVFETGRFRLYVNNDPVVLPFHSGACSARLQSDPRVSALGQLLDIKQANFFE